MGGICVLMLEMENFLHLFISNFTAINFVDQLATDRLTYLHAQRDELALAGGWPLAMAAAQQNITCKIIFFRTRN